MDDESLLPLRQGDIVVVTEKNDVTGWYRGTCNGKEGAFPADIVKMMVLFSGNLLIVYISLFI